ncbi:hypothetical protein [Novosphingopyxis sp.]|uniref:hypothetical protein n=1 Tax=Novosphingopyxis sp. TaxID=2709690 RepID=UPI003B5B9AAA
MAAVEKTKAFYRFNQRCAYFETDLELCDLLVRNFIGLDDSINIIAVALKSTKKDHPKLTQKNTKNSRQVRGGHLRATLNSSFIKDIYEDFLEFLSETMARAAQKGVDPGRFAGDVKLDIKVTEIMATGSWDGVVRLVSDKIFCNLESERKTTNLITKAANRLGLNVNQQVLEAAMPYLDARHMLVHQDGKVDTKFREKYPDIVVKNNKLIIDSEFTRKARETIEELARTIDQEVIAAGLVKPEHMCP